MQGVWVWIGKGIIGTMFTGVIWGGIDWMEIGIVVGWIVKLDRSEYCRE